MFKNLSIFIFTCALAFSFGVDITTAQTGFVPCDGVGPDACSACDLAVMGNTILNWLIGFMFVIFAIVMTVAGFGLVTSGGNPSAKEAAKSKFVNAIVGLIIVLAAWILVDTIMRGVLAGTDGDIEGWGPWSQISCQSQEQARIVDRSDAFTDAGFIGPLPAGVTGSGGPVNASLIPGGGSCFPGANGVVDGPPEFTPGSDDVCIDSYTVTGADYDIPGGAPAGYTPPPGYFGPDAIAANPQITPNFRLCDVTNCDEARRRGDYVYVDPAMVQQLEGVQSTLGSEVQVNSGYRSPGYNAALPNGGGATHSRHIYGDAVDIAVTPTNTEAEIVASCKANGATFTMTYDSGRHVHCDWR